MLTLAQLRRIAQRNRIGLQPQERDYIQHLFLYLLYSAPRRDDVGLHFKGGTALRIVYSSPRFSEDMDFNSDLTLDETRTRLQTVVEELSGFGAQGILRNERQSPQGVGFELSYQGPLFDGRAGTKGKVRVDVSLRREQVELEHPLITPEYDDVEPFILSTLAREHLFAEKARALFVRAKPRDLYDLWFLLNKGIRANRALINAKLSLYELTFDLANLEKATHAVQTEWERDLKPLLGSVPEFREVQAVVLKGLEID
jgi:predicted nucleotidyltransferase component of viral defense system